MKPSYLLILVILFTPVVGVRAQQEPVAIPAPETRPTWDERWAHPELEETRSGRDETPGPMERGTEDPEAAAESEAPPSASSVADDEEDLNAGPGIGPPPSMADVMEKSRRKGVSWDFQLEIGVTAIANFWDWDHFAFDDWSFISKPAIPVFMRVSTGLLVLREPWYFGIGPTVSYGGIGDFAVGAQVELTSIWGGVWGQAEIAWNLQLEDLVVSIAGGYQVIGVELKTGNGGRDIAAIVKVRAPIGLIAFVRGYLDNQPHRTDNP